MSEPSASTVVNVAGAVVSEADLVRAVAAALLAHVQADEQATGVEPPPPLPKPPWVVTIEGWRVSLLKLDIIVMADKGEDLADFSIRMEELRLAIDAESALLTMRRINGSRHRARISVGELAPFTPVVRQQERYDPERFLPAIRTTAEE